MGYLAVWETLEKMIADFRKKGESVPTDVIRDLKSTRTIIRISKADPTCGEHFEQIDKYLTNVESYLISQGEKKFGQAYVEEWLRQIDKAARQTDEEEEETRFVSGLSAEHKWIRLTPSNELPLEKLEALAEESNLEHKTQNGRYLIVSGSEQVLKDFVKKIAGKYKSKAEKEH